MNIVAGVYKKQGKGIYKRPCGEKKKMCVVVILDGDQRYTRSIYLSSIEPAKKTKKSKDETEIAAIRDEMKALQHSLQKLTLRLNELEKKN